MFVGVKVEHLPAWSGVLLPAWRNAAPYFGVAEVQGTWGDVTERALSGEWRFQKLIMISDSCRVARLQFSHLLAESGAHAGLI